MATAALEDAPAYAQSRESFGAPIWKHQAVGNHLADMATTLTAARQLTRYAAEALRQRRALRYGGRHGCFVRPETAMEIALNAVRIHGDTATNGIRRGALLPRRAADDRRRGHQRDPTQRHRRSTGRPRRPGGQLTWFDDARHRARTASRRTGTTSTQRGSDDTHDETGLGLAPAIQLAA